MESKLLKIVEDLVGDKSFAIGNDVVLLTDFQKSFNDLFKNKVYTLPEVNYCDSFDDALLHYASTFAAKEAVYKALKQLDDSPIGWKKIEIIREKLGGKPEVIIHRDSAPQISLTITHDGDYVWAVALIATDK
ncbi:holo-ACP synthase [Mucilaginibacter gynuensis]|uniref:Holo-ACP synthase n=1 Tax=Mucilaginibacter gynuensis TaxID=1302236 RepID=A0ABP8FVG2_9SPHI